MTIWIRKQLQKNGFLCGRKMDHQWEEVGRDHNADRIDWQCKVCDAIWATYANHPAPARA